MFAGLGGTLVMCSPMGPRIADSYVAHTGGFYIVKIHNTSPTGLEN